MNRYDRYRETVEVRTTDEEIGGVFNADEYENEKINWGIIIKIWFFILLFLFSFVYTIKLAITI